MKKVSSLKLTAKALKMDGWNTHFLLGWPIFRCYVSFREGSVFFGCFQSSSFRKDVDFVDHLKGRLLSTSDSECWNND